MWQLNFVGSCSSVRGAQFFPFKSPRGEKMNVGTRFFGSEQKTSSSVVRLVAPANVFTRRAAATVRPHKAAPGFLSVSNN